MIYQWHIIIELFSSHLFLILQENGQKPPPTTQMYFSPNLAYRQSVQLQQSWDGSQQTAQYLTGTPTNNGSSGREPTQSPVAFPPPTVHLIGWTLLYFGAVNTYCILLCLFSLKINR